MMRVPEDASFGDIDNLGVTEYWIMDEDTVLVKSSCRPFMVGPGLRVTGPEEGGESKRAYASPKERTPKRPGFLSEGIPGVTVGPDNVFGPESEKSMFGGLGNLGYWEVLAPTGGVVASFRCRPYWTMEELTVKQVVRGQETLRTPGSAPFPAGTTRPRTQILRSFRRG